LKARGIVNFDSKDDNRVSEFPTRPLAKSRSTRVAFTSARIDPPFAFSLESFVTRDLRPVTTATALCTFWMAMRTSGFGSVASGTIDFARSGKSWHGDGCKRKQSGSKEKFFHPRTVAAGLHITPPTHASDLTNAQEKYPTFRAPKNITYSSPY
jgi:hypothetical protein